MMNLKINQTSSHHMGVLWILVMMLFVPVVSWRPDDLTPILDIKYMKFNKNENTTSRLSAPVPQLQCVGWWLNCLFDGFNQIICVNMGKHAYEFEWECLRKGMDYMYRLREWELNCQLYHTIHGYYIREGSCYVKYKPVINRDGGAFILGFLILLMLLQAMCKC